MSAIIESTKYLTKGDKNLLSALKKSIDNKLVNVTCIGLYNHGKSSLLNVLIGDFEDDDHATFKVSDARETTEEKSIEYDNINYIDTPGLNAKEHDDKRTLDSVEKSDINLFVHKVTAGEFYEHENKFLQKIKSKWSNPADFVSKTIFVLSAVDGAKNENDISKAINKMKNQLKEMLGTDDATFIPVSAQNYKKGKLENKALLIKKSNIDKLKEELSKLIECRFDSIKQTKKDRLLKMYDKMLKNIVKQHEQKSVELIEEEQAKKEFVNSFNSDIKNIESTLESMYNDL